MTVNQDLSKPDFLGFSVSRGLDFSKPSSPINKNLPQINDLSDLEDLSKFSLKEIIFLAHKRKFSAIDHYHRFLIPKKDGSFRDIASSTGRLKEIQVWIKSNILDYFEGSSSACAYIKDKSIVDCAFPHQKKNVVIRIDIEDFFGSFGFGAVRSAFFSLGYNKGVSTVLALLCTDDKRIKVKNKGTEFFIPSDKLHLPQGAPTSPALSNIFFNHVDLLVRKAAKKNGFCYTRYADDLFFSNLDSFEVNLDKSISFLIRDVSFLLKKNGFKVNKSKTKIMREGQRQLAVGILLNEKLTLTIDRKKEFRSMIDWCEKNNLYPYAYSYINGIYKYFKMIDKNYAEKIIKKHPWIDKKNESFSILKVNNWIDLKKAEIFKHPKLGVVFVCLENAPTKIIEKNVTKYVKLVWIPISNTELMVDWGDFLLSSNIVKDFHLRYFLTLKYAMSDQKKFPTTNFYPRKIINVKKQQEKFIIEYLSSRKNYTRIISLKEFVFLSNLK